MDKKNTLLLTVIAVATLLVAIVGATFAYFTAQVGEGANVDIRVETSTADTTMFGSFDNILIQASQLNFNATNEDDGTKKATQSLIGSSNGYVSFKANNNTGKGDYCYMVNLDVTNNNFIYSLNKTAGDNTGDYYPELILRVGKAIVEGKALEEAYAGKYSMYGSDNSDLEGAGEDYSDMVLHTATNLDGITAEDVDSEPETSITYKENVLTGAKICKSNTAAGTSDCTDANQTISGYDITMLGYNGSKSGSDSEKGKTWFDISGLPYASKHIVRIPASSTTNEGKEYIHTININKSSSASETDLTVNHYWNVDVIFVNYSDKDINYQAGADHQNTPENQAGLGDQNYNTDKTFEAKLKFTPVDCDTGKSLLKSNP